MATATETAKAEISFDDYMAMPVSRLPTEVIDGVLIVMPTPTYRHQRILMKILRPLDEQISQLRLGVVIPSPADLVIRKLPKLRVRQPDIMFFSDIKASFVVNDDPNRIFNECLAPDLAVEVLSPGQNERTLADKLADYASIAIDEVWFVDQDLSEIRVLVLDGSDYRLSGAFGIGDRLVSTVLPELDLAISAVFE